MSIDIEKKFDKYRFEGDKHLDSGSKPGLDPDPRFVRAEPSTLPDPDPHPALIITSKS